MPCAGGDLPMHPELRLIEDFMTDRGVLNLPALPRMLYVVRGSITSGRRTVRMGETLYSEETPSRRMPRGPARRCGAGSCPIRASRSPRWRARASLRATSSRSRSRHCRRANCSGAATAWRFRRAAAPICIAIRGPGIRCVIDGELRVDTGGQSHTHGVGEAWYRGGTRSGVRAGRRPADALHPRDDPAARADRQKLDPVRQRRRQGQAEVADSTACSSMRR